MSAISERPAFAPRGSSFLAKLGAVMRTAIENRQRYVAARNLSRLNDYMLKDLGISRSQIPSAVDGLLTRCRENAE